MANPIKAVKAIGRAVGGITGKGSKNVNPIYKNMNLSKAEARANARGLKAANKIKLGSKNVADDKEKNNYKYWDKAYNQYAEHTGKEPGTFGINTENALKFSKPARPNRVRGGSMGSKVNWPKGMK
jgi:hypothetical protein